MPKEAIDGLGGSHRPSHQISIASASVITEAKKPTVIMLSSTSAVIDKSRYFLRTSCTLSQSSRIMADWAIKNDIKKIVTLVTDFAPGHEAEGVFRDGYLAAGGQIAEAGPLLFEPLRSTIRKYAMDDPGRAVRIAPAELKADAPLVGAVAMALQSLNR